MSSIGGSHAIVSGPSIGAQNILLMGLESRTDWNGNILPDDVLEALHACNRQEIENGCGGNDTNTLILIHIPAGGKKAVGFSIPLIQWFFFADTLGSQQIGKIDQAYGVSLAARESQVQQQDPGVSQDQSRPSTATRRAARPRWLPWRRSPGCTSITSPRSTWTGSTSWPRSWGGVEVCLNHPVPLDPNSGFYATRAENEHLSPKMALAFVRQRDGLPNGDLDRTHRQQAFLDSVLEALRTDGVLDDLTKVQALLSVGKQYVITDSGWNLLDFVSQMRNISSGDITFRTLPIENYSIIGGQDVNIVNPSYIKQLVQETFYPAPASPSPKPAASSATTADAWRDHGRRLQRRQHPGPGRAGLGGTGQAGV